MNEAINANDADALRPFIGVMRNINTYIVAHAPAQALARPIRPLRARHCRTRRHHAP